MKNTPIFLVQCRFNFLIFMAFIFIFAATARATEMKGLYNERVAVKNQSTDSRKKASREALLSVLVKTTGKSSILNHPDIQNALTSPQQYLRSFHFETDEQGLFYVAEFNQNSVQNLIRSAGYKVWDSFRADTLILLVVEENNFAKTLLLENSSHPMIEQIQQGSERQGLPITLPVLDLQNQFGVYDVWGEFSESIRRVSQNYQVDLVLFGKLYPVRQHSTTKGKRSDQWQAILSEDQSLLRKAPTDAKWQLEWNVLDAQPMTQPILFGQSQEELIGLLFNKLQGIVLTKMQGEQGQERNELTQFELRVEQVNSMLEFMTLSELIKKFAMVERIQVAELFGDKVVFQITAFGSEDRLHRLLLLDERASEKISDTDDNGANEIDLRQKVFLWSQ
jgi:hypothetical protein